MSFVRAMLERTRSAWERCVDRLPASPAELALQLIGFDRDVAPPDVACEHCGAELVQPAVVRDRVPMFCGERCRKDSSLVRASDRSSLAA